MPSPRRFAWIAAAALLAGAGPALAGETSAQRLHRKGVHCMEEIERSDCAIEHFEALLEERTEERELITDGLLRLIKLYEKAGDDDAVHAVMRRFWDAGRGKLRRGHLPYTTRFFPADFDVVGGAHMQRMLAAPMKQRLPPDITEYVLTCDEDRRKELEELQRYRKAEARARLKNQSLQAALDELGAEARKKSEARRKRAEARDQQRPRPAKPVFADGMCATATAFGETSPETWTRIAIGFHHADWRRSAAVIELPGLAARIAAGVAAGRLVPAGANTWTLVGQRYEGQTVQLATFELDELVIASETLMLELAASHRRGKRSLAKEVDRLIAGVPVDTGFFAVATERAVRDLGFSGMAKGRRKLLELLLPHPEGIQIAGVVHEYFGMFLRMPTDTPVKAGLLVDIVRRMIAGQAEADDDAADSLRLLDVAQASDKRALLLGYVLSVGQIETMMGD
jgi:hypothetical protein